MTGPPLTLRDTSTTPSPSPYTWVNVTLAEARATAWQEEWYLAEGDVVQHSTDWLRNRFGTVCVPKVSALLAKEELAAHTADPGSVPPPDLPPPSKHSIIARVEEDRCFVQADSNYKGPAHPAMSWQKIFAQTTLTFLLGPPPVEHTKLVQDWSVALQTLGSLMPKGMTDKSGHIHNGAGGTFVHMRHNVFAPKGPEQPAAEEEASLPVEYTIRGWPTYSPVSHDTLMSIMDMHVARPMPAFDVRGDLIPPLRYMAELRGATELVSFSITYYTISEKSSAGTDVFKTRVCLDVQYLRVLIAPPRFTMMKRAAMCMTDPSTSWSKKARLV
ncbi:hypothetical protein C8T65DRAFT_745478 [Cerioporus squamosus]|nr:hypothetical protein C8T65DRAFT_745478 [Cerioporus squamosus]